MATALRTLPADAGGAASRGASWRTIFARINGKTPGELTRDARLLILQQAVAGNRDAIEFLRSEADWFPQSTSYTGAGGRSPHDPPATDAEIIEAAKAYLRDVYGVTTSAAPAASARANAKPNSAGLSPWAEVFARVNGRKAAR